MLWSPLIHQCWTSGVRSSHIWLESWVGLAELKPNNFIEPVCRTRYRSLVSMDHSHDCSAGAIFTGRSWHCSAVFMDRRKLCLFTRLSVRATLTYRSIVLPVSLPFQCNLERDWRQKGTKAVAAALSLSVSTWFGPSIPLVSIVFGYLQIVIF